MYRDASVMVPPVDRHYSSFRRVCPSVARETVCSFGSVDRGGGQS